MKPTRWLLAVAWMVAAVAAHGADIAKDPAENAKDPVPANPASAVAAGAPQDLTGSQQKLANEFGDLEGVLMRMRDLIRPTDPNRAALIEKALKESGDRRVSADFQEIVDLLRQDQLGNAARKQGKVNEDLEAILQLLLSEDSAKRLKDRQTELRKYLERLNNIIRDQGDVLGRTKGGENPRPLSVEQGGLAQRTGGLSKDINKGQEKDRGAAKDDSKGDPKNKDSKNGGKAQPGDGKPQSGDGKPRSGDGKPSDKSDGKESKPGKEGDKSDGKDPKSDKDDKADGKESKNDKGDKSDGKNDDKAKPGDDGKSQQGKGQQGKSQQGKSQQGKGQPSKSQGQGQQGQDQDQDSDQQPQQAQDQNSQPQEQNPVRKRLQAAQEHMEEAEKRLKKAQKDGGGARAGKGARRA